MSRSLYWAQRKRPQVQLGTWAVMRHLVGRHESLHGLNKSLVRAGEEAGSCVVVRAAEDLLDELGDPESTAAGEGYEQPVLEF